MDRLTRLRREIRKHSEDTTDIHFMLQKIIDASDIANEKLQHYEEQIYQYGGLYNYDEEIVIEVCVEFLATVAAIGSVGIHGMLDWMFAYIGIDKMQEEYTRALEDAMKIVAKAEELRREAEEWQKFISDDLDNHPF